MILEKRIHSNTFEMYPTIHCNNFIEIERAEQKLCKIYWIMFMTGEDQITPAYYKYQVSTVKISPITSNWNETCRKIAMAVSQSKGVVLENEFRTGYCSTFDCTFILIEFLIIMFDCDYIHSNILSLP